MCSGRPGRACEPKRPRLVLSSIELYLRMTDWCSGPLLAIEFAGPAVAAAAAEFTTSLQPGAFVAGSTESESFFNQANAMLESI
jgi:hypothetical protein